MYEQEILPAPPQNTPFSGLILKVGKMNYCLGKMDPIWAKCLKSGQNCSRSGQKNIIHSNLCLAGSQPGSVPILPNGCDLKSARLGSQACRCLTSSGSAVVMCAKRANECSTNGRNWAWRGLSAGCVIRRVARGLTALFKSSDRCVLSDCVLRWRAWRTSPAPPK